MRPASVMCTLALCAFILLSWTALSTANPGTPDQTQGIPGTPTPDPGPESNEPSPLSASWSLTLASRYLFQGIDYSDGNPVLNPELDIAAGPISAKIWANHNLDRGVSDEFDFSLVHEWSAKKFSVATGYTYLRYPHRDGWDPSQEFFVDLSREGVLNPSLSIHYDFDAGTGTYSTLGLSHTISVPLGDVSFGTNLFYQANYYDISGFPSFEGNVNFTRSFGKFQVTPSMSRFVTWENGDFRSLNALPAQWLFSLQVGRGL